MKNNSEVAGHGGLKHDQPRGLCHTIIYTARFRFLLLFMRNTEAFNVYPWRTGHRSPTDQEAAYSKPKKTRRFSSSARFFKLLPNTRSSTKPFIIANSAQSPHGQLCQAISPLLSSCNNKNNNNDTNEASCTESFRLIIYWYYCLHAGLQHDKESSSLCSAGVESGFLSGRCRCLLMSPHGGSSL